MTTATLERINQLSAERQHLYSEAGARTTGRGQRIGDLTAELDTLWEARRRERVGQAEGIDLLVERAYAQLYGEDFAEVVAPPTVADREDKDVTLAA